MSPLNAALHSLREPQTHYDQACILSVCILYDSACRLRIQDHTLDGKAIELIRRELVELRFFSFHSMLCQSSVNAADISIPPA